MAVRLGSGEYERTDVEIKNSTLVARHKFLQTLWKKRNYWAFDLLQLFNPDEVQKEFLERDKLDQTFGFFLPYLLNRNPHNFEIRREIIDTPVINYYWYLLDKENLIKQFERYFLQEFETSLRTTRRRQKAIKKFISSWKDLKAKDDAQNLCHSLERWSRKYNLTDDWLIDFALYILCLFKINFDAELSEVKPESLTLNELHTYHFNYEHSAREAVSKAISDYGLDIIWEKQGDWFDDLGELPAFEYKWRNFEVQPITWIYRMMSRKNFVEAASNNLEQTRAHIRSLKRIWQYSNEEELNSLVESRRNYLKNYCDYVEKLQIEGSGEDVVSPATFDESMKVVWQPSKQGRELFITETLAELKAWLQKMDKAERSLQSFTKKDFEAKLSKYCNKVEKNLPDGWERTPVKYSEDQHFAWLIDYQVAPSKSFTEIAKENNVDRKTVSEAVKELAAIIRISLRKPVISGRPKNSKNSEKSNRQLRILNK